MRTHSLVPGAAAGQLVSELTASLSAQGSRVTSHALTCSMTRRMCVLVPFS